MGLEVLTSVYGKEITVEKFLEMVNDKELTAAIHNYENPELMELNHE
jgi:hypothetical protein